MPQNVEKGQKLSDQSPIFDAGSKYWGGQTCGAGARRATWLIGLNLVAALVLALGSLANASPQSEADDNMCDAAARIAASGSDVPLSVLLAITRSETGRARKGGLQPWPWTVNMEGKGVWFETEDEARGYVFKNFKRGARNFDVGCFQINYKWHGTAFSSIDEMFDPLANAEYAARFLSDLHAELGDWSKAAGAYHSRTPQFANKYIARFDRIHAAVGQIESRPSSPNRPARAPQQVARNNVRENQFPLLQAGGTSAMGSLVPISAGTGRSLFGTRFKSGG